MGTLYIVATPIGNLEDITLRALRILREVSLIACEDTRTSRVLLQHYDIHTPLTSYHEHNKLGKLDAIFDALAEGDVALISDAGTPAISDPGYELVQACIEAGHTIVPIPGASAVIAGLVTSGLPTDSFVYLGFLPKKASVRRKLLQDLAQESRTLVAYESPHRTGETLGIISDVLGASRPVCIAREITKKFEEFWRGRAEDAAQRFSEENPRGEVTLIIGGRPSGDDTWDEARVLMALQAQREEGASLSRAAKTIAQISGWKKNEVYNLGLRNLDS